MARKIGFAVMDHEDHIKASRKGGRVGHHRGTANEWTSDQARAAGFKSGEAKRKKKAEQKQDS